MATLDHARLDSIVDEICNRLEGEWLIVGGAIAALWFAPRRTTEDVDIVSLRGTSEDRLALLELADSLGLPVESMNSAADFFVHRVLDWRAQLVPFRSGPKATVYRPTATLFLLLKVRRLDERDLEDCRTLVATGQPFDRARVVEAIDALAAPTDTSVAARRSELRRLIAPGKDA